MQGSVHAERAGCLRGPCSSFMKMQLQRLQPNEVTCNAVISACGKGWRQERALQLFAMMR